MVEQDGSKTEREIDYRIMREFDSGPRCEYFELWRDKQSLYRSRSWGSRHLEAIEGSVPSELLRTVQLPD